MEQPKSSWHSKETVTASKAKYRKTAESDVPGLTILALADARRIGERAILHGLAAGRDTLLSRLSPDFGAPGLEGGSRPLADTHLSRAAIRLSGAEAGAVRLDAGNTRTKLEVEGIPVQGERVVSLNELERGVVLVLSGRVALLLHLLDPEPPNRVGRFGLVGESQDMVAVRRQIETVADLDVPVLVRGETGTGKELVANGIHRASARRSGPFVAVNMGALPPALAAAELFGAVQGAFTGADRNRKGHFAKAQNGTFFLDEIGETPPEVQAMLLRALETSEIQPVGSDKTQKVDVRIVAATDAQLERSIEEGRFRAPLLHRLGGYEIRLPPLRDRREDIGRLLAHFLGMEFDALGQGRSLEGQGNPLLSAGVVARLTRYTWPGNVRQLRNVVRQLVFANQGAQHLKITPQIEALLSDDIQETEIGARVAISTPEEPPKAVAAKDQPVFGALLLIERIAPHPLTRQMLLRHDQEARRLLEVHSGYEIEKHLGFLFHFNRPADAVAYALDYQDFLTQLADDSSEFAARIGIHFSEMWVRHNSAAEVALGAKAIEVEELPKMRMEGLTSLAVGGQILLTRAAYEMIPHGPADAGPLAAPGIRWLSHGLYRIDEEEEPVEIFEVGRGDSAPMVAPTLGAAESEGEKKGARAYRSPNEVSEDELLAALRSHSFRIQPTAAVLRVSRTSLYALIEKSSQIRKAKDLSREEIEKCIEDHKGNLDAMAAELEVSRKGLRRRMTALGLE